MNNDEMKIYQGYQINMRDWMAIINDRPATDSQLFIYDTDGECDRDICYSTTKAYQLI